MSPGAFSLAVRLRENEEFVGAFRRGVFAIFWRRSGSVGHVVERLRVGRALFPQLGTTRPCYYSAVRGPKPSCQLVLYWEELRSSRMVIRVWAWFSGVYRVFGQALGLML